MEKVQIGIYGCLTADILIKFYRNVPWVVPYLNFVQTAEAIWAMKLKFYKNKINISRYKIYVFYYCCSCTLVAMAT